MILQTKNAINKLKAAGLTRNQFSVKTERIYIKNSIHNAGKAQYEYGDAIIVLWGKQDDLIQLAPAMAKAGLHVTIRIFDKVRSIRVTDEYKNAGIWEYDYRDTDDYGLPKTRKIM